MVTVKSFSKRETKDGRSFISLELVGSAELVQSSSTGKFYATVRKCRIPATFDETTAATLVGTRMPGEIVRIDCDPYEYTIQSTGEVVLLQHTFGYQPTPSGEVVREQNMLAEA